MLPPHAYPKLKNIRISREISGTAWQNQQKEFDSIPAPVLFTTNCIMPPKPSYADRVLLTETVAFPDTVHIGEDKDFDPLSKKALELGGYAEDMEFKTGVNGGKQVTTGFGHRAILSNADKVVAAVKSGAPVISLVGGCDGARIQEKLLHSNL